MRKFTRRIAAGIAVLVLATLLTRTSHAQDATPAKRTAPFRVFAADGKTLLYVGEYLVERSGSRITESQRYLTADGKPFKLDLSVYDAETRRPVSFYTQDNLTGDVFRVAVNGDAISGQAENAAGAVKAKFADTLPQGAFLWPNLVNVLSERWDQVAGGQTIELELFLMSRQTTISLELKPDGRVDVSGVAGIQVKAEPKSWVFRQIASPTWLTLSVDPPHRFLRFKGQGAVKTADGKDIDTVIEFDWANAR